MPDPAILSRVLRFGVFEVDLRTGELRKQGLKVKLHGQPIDVLAMLLERPGELVTREEIQRRLWPADTFVDFDHSLNTAIKKLREALGDEADSPRFIETLPRRGYRFIVLLDVGAGLKPAPTGSVAAGTPQEVGETPGVAPREAPPRPDTVGLAPSAPSTGVSPRVITGGVTRRAIAAAVQGSLEAHGTGTRWRLLAAALGILAVAGVILALHLGRPQPSVPPQRALTRLTFDAGLQTDPTWSPDGRMFAYASDLRGNFDIYVQQVGSVSSIRITDSPAHDWQPDWSPDGKLIVFRSERDGGGLYVVPALGGHERKISSFGYRPRWSPDGSLILFQDAFPRETHNLLRGQYIVGLDGSPPRRILAAQMARMLADADSVDWYPEGQRISVWGQSLQGGHRLVTFSLADGTAVRSESSESVQEQFRAARVNFWQFRWGASGRALYFEGLANGVRSLWKVSVDPATLRWVAGPERLTTGPGQDTGMALSRDGKNLVFGARSENTRAWVFLFDTRAGTMKGNGYPVTPAGADTFHLNLSPDGMNLAFLMERAGKKDLWLRSLKDGRETLLAEDCDCSMLWSRDGKRIAYLRRHPNQARKWFMVPAGGGDAQLLADDPMQCGQNDWSEDGRFILGHRVRGNPARYELCLSSFPAAFPTKTTVRVLASRQDLPAYELRFSPGDRWIVFEVVDPKEPGVTTIQVMPAEGGEWTPVTEGRFWDDKPRWAPDGKTIYFVSNRTGLFNVWGRRFDLARGKPVGVPFQVTAFNNPARMISDRTSAADIALSKQRLVLPITEISGSLWMLESVDR